MARKSLKRVADGGTVTVTPSSTEDLLTNPAIDNILASTDVGFPTTPTASISKTTLTLGPTGQTDTKGASGSTGSSPKLCSVFEALPVDISSKPSAPIYTSGVKIAKMQTVKLGNNPTDISIGWGSSFDPKQVNVFLHRVSITSNPTGHLSAPVFEGQEQTHVRFRVVRDNTPVPEGSIYLGSYSDVHVGPSMQALHVFLIP